MWFHMWETLAYSENSLEIECHSCTSGLACLISMEHFVFLRKTEKRYAYSQNFSNGNNEVKGKTHL